jgi:hypothetical protein
VAAGAEVILTVPVILVVRAAVAADIRVAVVEELAE